MKQSYSRLLLTIAFLLSNLLLMAENSVVLYPEPENPEIGEWTGMPDPGRRDSPVPVICEIDFEHNTVSGSAQLDEVTEYQVWDETGTACLSISAEAATFVEALKALPSPQSYLIKLKADSFVLSGYIFLE